jgi:AcrR family transcriptional regulator
MTQNLHQLKSELTRERLLNSALEVMEKTGAGHLSLQDVAKMAGMTTGAVQHHFPSKAALMMQVLSRLIDSLESSSDIWPSPHWPLKQRADHFVQQAWQQLYGQPRFLSAWTAYLAARDDAAMTAHIVEQRAAIQLRVKQRFAAAFPEMASGPQADTRIQCVFTTLRGLGLVRPFASPDIVQPQLAVLSELIQIMSNTPKETS